MNKQEMMAQLEALGTDQTRKIFSKHGIQEPFFGVKVADLKKLAKGNKKNNELAMELYDTGNYDAMYLAGILLNTKVIDKQLLQHWMNGATCSAISEYIVASVAGDSSFAVELANEWIQSDNTIVIAGGWSTYSNYLSIVNNELVDLGEVKQLLDTIKETIHSQSDRVKYTMNNFVICVGAYVESLSEYALEVAEHIGTVKVDMGATSCKVPSATENIQKVVGMNRCGVKRKSCRC